jgi:hypothetical protein
MKEHQLISASIGLSALISPIMMFLYAKWAIEEIKSLFWNVFVPIYIIYTDRFLYKIGMGSQVPEPDLSKYTFFCWKFFLMALRKIAWILSHTFFTVWFAILFYESAKWTFLSVKTIFEGAF